MDTIIKILLSPFSLIFWVIMWFRNKLFDWEILPSKEFRLPVICVGNITVGGTGKTPHVEMLVEWLRDEFHVAVLSRGYKRKSKGFFIADYQPDPSIIGDEPCQIKSKFPEIIVAVDEKRVRGIEKLMALPDPPDVILLDDAFQHRRVRPGVNILLFDFNRMPSTDMLLPAGRLRESSKARKRAQFILVTKSPKRLKAIDMRLISREMKLHEFQHLYFTFVEQEEIKPVFSSDTDSIRQILENKPEILIVSGIANPRNIKPLARKYSTRIQELIFPDHHNYSSKDVHAIKSEMEMLTENSILLTTEKDAVKFQKLENEFEGLKEKMFYLPIRIGFLNNDMDNFKKQILNYVRDNKRNSVLHKGKSQV